MGYIGVITHLLTIDPNFLGHPSKRYPIYFWTAFFEKKTAGVTHHQTATNRHHRWTRLKPRRKTEIHNSLSWEQNALRRPGPVVENVHQRGGGTLKKNVTVDKGQQELLGNQQNKYNFCLCVVGFLGGYDVFCCFFPKWELNTWDQRKLWKVTHRYFFVKRRALPARWAPYQLEIELELLHTWPYKWVTGVITLLIGVITPFRTGFFGPPCRHVSSSFFPDLAKWVATSSSLTTGNPQGESTREAREKGNWWIAFVWSTREELCPNVSKLNRCFTQH